MEKNSPEGKILIEAIKLRLLKKFGGGPPISFMEVISFIQACRMPGWDEYYYNWDSSKWWVEATLDELTLEEKVAVDAENDPDFETIVLFGKRRDSNFPKTAKTWLKFQKTFHNREKLLHSDNAKKRLQGEAEGTKEVQQKQINCLEIFENIQEKMTNLYGARGEALQGQLEKFSKEELISLTKKFFEPAEEDQIFQIQKKLSEIQKKETSTTFNSKLLLQIKSWKESFFQDMPAKSLENLSKVFQENRKITLLESEISSLLMKFAEAITIEREEEARQYDLAIERALHWMEDYKTL